VAAAGKRSQNDVEERVEQRFWVSRERVWVYVLSVTAAALFAGGSVVQQHVAGQAPPEKTFSAGLLLWLARRRAWLAGVVISLGGNVLAALALGKGGVALVEPLFTARLLFALPLAAAWGRLAVPRRDWAGAAAVVAGLAVFIAVGRPRRGSPLQASAPAWAAALAVLAVLVAVAVLAARRISAVRAAAALAAGAGLLFGLQSSLTETAVTFLRQQGAVGLLTHWQTYMAAAAALGATVLVQNAFGIAPLHASFPVLVTAEPLAGLLLGVLVLGGALRVSPSAYAGEAGGFVVMMLGVWVLAHSPLVTGQAHFLQRRRDEALAYHVLGRLEALVQTTEEGGAAADGGHGHVALRSRRAAQLRHALAELDGLLADMAIQHAAELDSLQKLPSRERIALAPLERELDERQQRLATRIGALRRELDANGG
jgi:drug/metabolite transporter (DMT)-like permease